MSRTKMQAGDFLIYTGSRNGELGVFIEALTPIRSLVHLDKDPSDVMTETLNDYLSPRQDPTAPVTNRFGGRRIPADPNLRRILNAGIQQPLVQWRIDPIVPNIIVDDFPDDYQDNPDDVDPNEDPHDDDDDRDPVPF